MPLASYRLYIIVSVSVAKYCLWSRPVSGWVGGEGFFCEVSVFSGLCSWTCACMWVGRALGQ